MTRDDIMDTNELAEILGVQPATIRQKVKRHQIPYIKVGNTLIFSKFDLVRWKVLEGYIDSEGCAYCLRKPD